MKLLKKYHQGGRESRHLEEIQHIVDKVGVPLCLRYPTKDGIPWMVRFYPKPGV